MNRKRNVNYIKPEDPEFLKVIKRQAGYDDRNRKFDQLENAEEDFVNDTESEEPQVVVLRAGDLTAEEVEVERKRLEKEAEQTKADLSQRVVFKPKSKKITENDNKKPLKNQPSIKKQSQLLSFGDEDDQNSSSSSEITENDNKKPLMNQPSIKKQSQLLSFGDEDDQDSSSSSDIN